MAQGIANTALTDLLRTTQVNLPFDGAFEVTLLHPRYHVINKWFAEDKIQLDSGTSIQRNVVLDPQGNAQHVRVYQKVPVTVRNQQTLITAEWVQVLTRYSISRQEILRNRKKAGYISMLKSKRVASMVDLANLLELRAWASPENASDTLNPQGLPFWLNKVDASVSSTGDYIGQTARFNDGTTTTTTIGGINTANESHWRNWAFTYDAIDADFVKRLREAFFATDFQAPVIADDLVKGPLSNYRIYMGRRVLVEFTDLTTRQNDNLGSDLAPFEGNVSFRKVPIFHTPQINDDTDDPVYGVNHEFFFPYVLEGDWLREGEPETDVEQPSVFTTTIEGSYQYFCTNKREAGFVGSLVPSV